MKRLVASFVAGLVFAVGLSVAGMTRPGKVLAFLDVFGRWDPSLAFVMVGAIVFVGSMFVGMAIQRRFPRHAAPARPSASSGA
jgi:uncharacterized membrane protein YedE/YeeE